MRQAVHCIQQYKNHKNPNDDISGVSSLRSTVSGHTTSINNLSTNKQDKLKFKDITTNITLNLDGNSGYYIAKVGISSFSGYVSTAICNIPIGGYLAGYGYGVCSTNIRSGMLYASSTVTGVFTVVVIQIYT